MFWPSITCILLTAYVKPEYILNIIEGQTYK
jgi:hypothetical protein